MNVFICDDDSASISQVKVALFSLLSDVEVDLQTFQDPQGMLSSIEKKNNAPDLMILDIVMDRMNGIETAKRVTQAAPNCQIIFISSYDDFVSDVYEVPHCYFVRKTELSRHLGKALSKALQNLTDRQLVSFRENGEMKAVDAGQILYLERELRQTRIACTDAEYRTYAKPEVLLQQAESPYFHRCHQSYWVNFLYVSAFREDAFTLRDKEKTEIPISRSYRKQVREAWFSFLHRRYLPEE